MYIETFFTSKAPLKIKAWLQSTPYLCHNPRRPGSFIWALHTGGHQYLLFLLKSLYFVSQGKKIIGDQQLQSVRTLLKKIL